MYKVLLIVAILPAIAFGQTPFRPCRGGGPTPDSVSIEGCTELPCTIVSGSPLIARATGIRTPVATATVEAHITARVLGLDVGFRIPEDLADACAVGITGATCPLAAGQQFDYTLNYAMTLPLTGITAQVEVGLTAADGSTITCIEIDAQIVSEEEQNYEPNMVTFPGARYLRSATDLGQSSQILDVSLVPLATMYKFLLIAALLPAVVFGQTPFRPCSNGQPTPASLNIEGCTALPCTITSGAPLVARGIGIVSPVATPTLTADLTARLLGLDVGFEIPEELRDACAVGISGASCPIAAGQTFDYELNYAMELPLVGITVQVEVGLTAADGTAVTCIEIDATIVG
uniref:MD-2-related lipid-recognition domain-containing protein n=1 Tax=Anopheles epiroticus TaxID=199890 RepID=A0A182PQU6_9DIPT